MTGDDLQMLAGIGFYFPLAVAVILTLGVLSFFRWIEVCMRLHHRHVHRSP